MARQNFPSLFQFSIFLNDVISVPFCPTIFRPLWRAPSFRGDSRKYARASRRRSFSGESAAPSASLWRECAAESAADDKTHAAASIFLERENPKSIGRHFIPRPKKLNTICVLAQIKAKPKIRTSPLRNFNFAAAYRTFTISTLRSWRASGEFFATSMAAPASPRAIISILSGAMPRLDM